MTLHSAWGQSPAFWDEEAPVLRNHFLLAATIFFPLSPTSHAQTHNTVVGTINLLHAAFDSNEGKKELPAIGTKVSQERQQRITPTVQAILVKMAPVDAKFAEDNGLGVVTDTSKQLPEPVIWSKEPGGIFCENKWTLQS
jgi:hypothetical protein